MKRPWALDLFCGAGGAAMGLHRAGFDVVGVDVEEQPEFPFEFVRGDALTHPIEGFDFVWASPMCQRYSSATRQTGNPDEWPEQIEPTRARLRAAGVPYVIENVVGSPLLDPVLLCGAMFGLGVIRHRLFECSFVVLAPPHGKHRGSLVTGEYVTVAGNGGVPAWTMKEREKRGMDRHRPGEYELENWQKAMGIDWMSRDRLVRAIPPAYAEFLGRVALRLVRG